MLKRRRFPVEIILVCVRWSCKYGISYRDLAEMMQERKSPIERRHVRLFNNEDNRNGRRRLSEIVETVDPFAVDDQLSKAEPKQETTREITSEFATRVSEGHLAGGSKRVVVSKEGILAVMMAGAIAVFLGAMISNPFRRAEVAS